MNQPVAESATKWRQALLATVRAWRPLLVFELLISLLSTISLGPLLLSALSAMAGASDDNVLSNWEVAQFLVSWRGLVSVHLGIAAALFWLFAHYSGLLLIVDAALRGRLLTVREVCVNLVRAAPSLVALAIVCTTVALLLMLPFLALAALTYWLLLSGSDINFYLAERPPRFWAALLIGGLLTVALVISALWCFVRWAFAVPACVLSSQSWHAATRASTQLMRGRYWRVVLLVGVWLALQSAALAFTLRVLDWKKELILSGFGERLTALVWTTVALLIVEAIVLQLVATVFRIGTALLLAREYEMARRAHGDEIEGQSAEPRLLDTPAPSAWPAWVAIIAFVLVSPMVSLVFLHEDIEHRPAKVTAHRAGPKSAPENSLAALRLALAARADFVEIDVQKTADGQIVLLHDRDLRRVTGDPRDLNSVTLVDLKKLRLLQDGQPTNELIPTFAEFLQACGDKLRLNVELKDPHRSPQLAEAVVRELQKQGFTTRAVLSSFDLAALAEGQAIDPSIPVGVILTAARGDMTRLPVNFLSLNQRLVNTDVVRRAHARGMEVHAWTVDDRASAMRMLDLGCDNLITGDPVLMREVVDWHNGLSDVERALLRVRRWMRE